MILVHNFINLNKGIDTKSSLNTRVEVDLDLVAVGPKAEDSLEDQWTEYVNFIMFMHGWMDDVEC